MYCAIELEVRQYFDFKIMHKIYFTLEEFKGIEIAKAYLEYGPWHGI